MKLIIIRGVQKNGLAINKAIIQKVFRYKTKRIISVSKTVASCQCFSAKKLDNYLRDTSIGRWVKQLALIIGDETRELKPTQEKLKRGDGLLVNVAMALTSASNGYTLTGATR